jgi:hypothetical protein
MRTEHIVFENIPLLKKHAASDKNFYLHFDLHVGNDKYLKQIANICMENHKCRAMIFQIDQQRFVFRKLFFFKAVFEQLLVAGKQVVITGIPVCLIRAFLGGYLYMRFIYNQADEGLTFDCPEEKETIFLPMCESCIDKNGCCGVGRIDMAQLKPVIKKHLSPRPVQLAKPFDTDHVILNSMHQAYIKYCHEKESPVTYRTVYYVNNINFKSEHSYAERFVYGCDYISPDEYAGEFAFLREHVLHKQYIDLLQSAAKVEKTSQIAYSLAQKGTIFRESFYMFVSKQYGDRILKDFNVHYKYPHAFNMQFIGIGIDVIQNKIEGYKLYFQSTRDFLKNYLKPYGIEISRLKHNSYYLVLRLDKKQHFVSYKIEILIEYEDLKYFKDVMSDYDYYDMKLKQEGLYNIAIEIVDDQISKINIYHRHYFMKVSNDV